MRRPERSRQMLAVAGRVFAARGFHGASMDEIAEHAGISKPMLYLHFGSKEGLYVAYVREAGSALLTAMREATDPDAPAADRLWRGTLAFLGYVDEHRPGWALLYQEAASQGGPLAAEVAALRTGIVVIVNRLFSTVPGAVAEPPGAGAGAESAGAGAGAACEALAHAFVGAGESLANWWLEHPEEPRERMAELLIRLARGALPGLGAPGALLNGG